MSPSFLHYLKSMPYRPGALSDLIPEGQIVLRPLLFHGDLIGILEVYHECFGRLPPVMPMRRALLKHRWLLACVSHNHELKIIGFMIFAVRRRRKQVHVLRIAVTKQFRRHGIASQMLQDLIAHAKGYSIYAKVPEKNLAALELFKKLGFNSRLIRCPEKDQDTILFFRHG